MDGLWRFSSLLMVIFLSFSLDKTQVDKPWGSPVGAGTLRISLNSAINSCEKGGQWQASWRLGFWGETQGANSAEDSLVFTT